MTVNIELIKETYSIVKMYKKCNFVYQIKCILGTCMLAEINKLQLIGDNKLDRALLFTTIASPAGIDEYLITVYIKCLLKDGNQPNLN